MCITGAIDRTPLAKTYKKWNTMGDQSTVHKIAYIVRKGYGGVA